MNIANFFHHVNRLVVWPCQRLTRGFDEPDLWDLESSLAKIIAPRLRAFRDMKKNSVPVSDVPHAHCILSLDEDQPIEECLWFAMIDKMYQAFQMIADDEINSRSQERYVREGLALFATYFQHLWD
jgi:hypothetical protein